MAETKLNTNPEIVLKKRRNADRIRLEKQQLARVKKEEQARKAKQSKNKFLRVETILAKKMGNEKERQRVGRVAKVEKSSAQKLKLVQDSADVTQEVWDEKPKLLLIIRVQSGKKAGIPNKSRKVLEAMRLEKSNQGTFIKLTPTVLPLLKLVAPYIVIGTPDLVTVRELVQKRGTVIVEGEDGPKEVLLDDNSIIEDRLENYGIICTEDIVHEIFSLGKNFKQAMGLLRPFKLAPPVAGWGPIAKLKRMVLKEDESEASQRGDAPLVEVDINKYIANQN